MNKVIILGALLLAGCAAYEPATDLAGVNLPQYQNDLAYCKVIASDASGGGIGHFTYRQVIQNCLTARGYRLLDYNPDPWDGYPPWHGYYIRR